MSDLDARLLAAHAARDFFRLTDLYAEASIAASDEEATAFFLVHAYVYALETNHPKKETLRARLKAMGREA